MKLTRAVASATFVLALAACSAKGPDSPLAIDAQGKPGKGRALLYAEAYFAVCDGVTVTFAKKEGDKFDEVAFADISSNIFFGSKIASVDLDPGEYHVARVACSFGNGPIYRFIGPNLRDSAFFKQATITNSLGYFSLNAGEIVDIGSLVVVRKSIAGAGEESVLLVGDLAKDQLDVVRNKNPELGAKIVKRHVISNASRSDLDILELAIRNTGYLGRVGDEHKSLTLERIKQARGTVG